MCRNLKMLEYFYLSLLSCKKYEKLLNFDPWYKRVV